MKKQTLRGPRGLRGPKGKAGDNGIDLIEYGIMCQKINDIEGKLNTFITNEFHHLSTKVDWMFYLVIISLVGVVADLILRLAK